MDQKDILIKMTKDSEAQKPLSPYLQKKVDEFSQEIERDKKKHEEKAKKLKGSLPEKSQYFSKQINRLYSSSEYALWDAIFAWRGSIYQENFLRNTKSNYLTSMLKLIESKMIDVNLQLDKADESWLILSKLRIDDNPQWSTATKAMRKSCLKSFYSFIQNGFEYRETPYRRYPQPNEIKHILSSVEDKALTADISPVGLCVALSKINKRDVFIVYLMMVTGRRLEEILDLRKSKEDYAPPYIHFKGFGTYIEPHITEEINELSKNSKVYLFETSSGKRIRRNQITRNLRQAGHNIGLNFDLTPKVLHGYVNVYMSRDKRSVIEKLFSD